MPIITREQIAIRLSRPTLRRLNQLASPRRRSLLVEQALQVFFRLPQRDRLSAQVRDGARARAERDRGLAEESFDLND